MSKRADLAQGGTLIRVEGTTACFPESEDPTPGRWRVPAGRTADDEDSAYDWDQAG